MKIVIIGGGNIGSLLIGDLGVNKSNSIYLYTDSYDSWGNTVAVYNKNNALLHEGLLSRASNDKSEVFKNADLIISTLPSHIFPKIINEIDSFIPPNSIFAMMPGCGGGEYLCNHLLEKGCTLLGFQRVPGISRIKEKGKSVYSLGKKDNLFISTIPKNKCKDVGAIIENLFKIKTHCLDNYLNVTLTPSNPILHTTRLYSLFQKYNNIYLEKPILFYENWDDESSDILLKCDNELVLLCEKITSNSLDVSSVIPLNTYYESFTPSQFTNKIKSINAFKGIEAPLKKTEKGFIPDFESRYFKEDFLYGLVLIKSCCVLFDIETPNIDKVLKWYSTIFNITLFVDEKFCLTNQYDLILPHLLFNNIDDFITYYKQ